ncbi:MAG: alpha/beta hydrolase fold domain-containing protein [Anaerolineales bacterium]
MGEPIRSDRSIRLHDALTTYRWLLDNSTPPGEIIIAGDSSGGGLALAALLSLRDAGDPLPAGGILISPWADLTLSSGSVVSKAKQDFILDIPHLKNMAALYAGEHDLTNPLISPVFADLSGLPPLLIQVGSDETLLDDAARIAANAEKAGVDVRLEFYQDMIHVFHMFPFFSETGQAFESIKDFSKNCLKADSNNT